jgi:Arc/MetJ family transcription regulator
MLLTMRTSIDLNDKLLRDAKRRAADERTTLRAVFERALRAYLKGSPERSAAYRLEWHPRRGRLRAGIDVGDRDSLFRAMDEGA